MFLSLCASFSCNNLSYFIIACLFFSFCVRLLFVKQSRRLSNVHICSLLAATFLLHSQFQLFVPESDIYLQQGEPLRKNTAFSLSPENTFFPEKKMICFQNCFCQKGVQLGTLSLHVYDKIKEIIHLTNL